MAGAGSQFDPVLVRSFLGVGLGKLWWIAGASAVLAQLPLVGWLWTTPAGAQTRKTGVGPAVAASALAVVAVAGGLASSEGETARRPSAQATAAPHVGFYSSGCTELGRLSPGGDQAAVPEGTRFLVVTARSGLSTQFTLVVVAAG